MNLISIRRLIPDVVEPFHFDDETLTEWIDDYTNGKRTGREIKYFVAYRAVITWYKDIKLNDVAVKQNSLSVGETGAAKEKLLDLLEASKLDLETEIATQEGSYFELVSVGEGEETW
jgi:hypothetical protein